MPRSLSATSRPAWSDRSGGVSGLSAAKSLSKTKVELYCGVRAPPALS
jgi:hypothetical protein